MTAVGLLASVVSALLMPKSVYEYITTAAGMMLLYNWLFILLTSGKLLKAHRLGEGQAVYRHGADRIDTDRNAVS